MEEWEALYQRQAEVLKALAHPVRLRIVRGLLVHEAQLPALLQVAVPEFLYSLVWTPVIWLLFRAIHNRVGGTKLA